MDLQMDERAGGQMDRRTDAASANVNNGGNSSSARALPGTEPLAYVHATFVAVWEEGVSSRRQKPRKGEVTRWRSQLGSDRASAPGPSEPVISATWGCGWETPGPRGPGLRPRPRSWEALALRSGTSSSPLPSKADPSLSTQCL